MRFAPTVAAFCGLLLHFGSTQTQTTVHLQPTRLEAFAAQSNAHIAWFRDVGQIESDEARVTVTALIIEDRSQPLTRMCGIRINLVNKTATDQVYIEQNQLEIIKNALEEIDSEIESFRKEPDSAPYRYHGAAEFWYPELKVQVHTLNAAYYIAPDSSGLSLSAYKNQQFIPNHRPSELAKVIGTAFNELKQQCGT